MLEVLEGDAVAVVVLVVEIELVVARRFNTPAEVPVACSIAARRTRINCMIDVDGDLVADNEKRGAQVEEVL